MIFIAVFAILICYLAIILAAFPAYHWSYSGGDADGHTAPPERTYVVSVTGPIAEAALQKFEQDKWAKSLSGDRPDVVIDVNTLPPNCDVIPQITAIDDQKKETFRAYALVAPKAQKLAMVDNGLVLSAGNPPQSFPRDVDGLRRGDTEVLLADEVARVLALAIAPTLLAITGTADGYCVLEADLAISGPEDWQELVLTRLAVADPALPDAQWLAGDIVDMILYGTGLSTNESSIKDLMSLYRQITPADGD